VEVQTPYRVTIPHSLNGPLEICADNSVVRMAVVERACAARLPDIWDTTGVYLLLDHLDAAGKWGAYVGKAAPGTLRKRLGNHLRAREHWYRALLIRRDTESPFHTSQVGWLEGRLYDILAEAELVQLRNGNRPQDHTMHVDDQASMLGYLPPILGALHLIGHNLTPPAATRRSPRSRTAGSLPPYALDTSGRDARRTKKHSEVSLADLMEQGMVQPGAELVSVSRLHPAKAKLTADARIEYEAIAYSKPSSAGHAVTGYSVNGWTFWEVETPRGPRLLSALRQELERRLASS